MAQLVANGFIDPEKADFYFDEAMSRVCNQFIGTGTLTGTAVDFSPSALSLNHVAAAIAHFVSFEAHRFNSLVWLWLIANLGRGTLIAVIRMETVIYVAGELLSTMKPGPGADEDSTGKPLRTVVSIGSARIGGDVIVTIRTIRGHSDTDFDTDLCVRFGCGSGDANADNGC